MALTKTAPQNDMLQWFIEAQETEDQYQKVADKIVLTNFAAIHTSSIVCRSLTCQKCTLILD